MPDTNTLPITVTEAPLESPFDGSPLDPTNTDALAMVHDQIKAEVEELTRARYRIEEAMLAACKDTRQTRHLLGETAAVKITMPPRRFTGSMLKKIWSETDPVLRTSLLQISSISVKMRDFKKLEEASGTPEFEAFRDAVKGAEETGGRPRVSVSWKGQVSK